ncbi:MAG TPA: alpha/beta fold hydrolase, partial [Solirubrobacteraceae bacterium]|nr:alpha/beta fold hydrolase [Solirubrobacteraceae bacterium]
MTTFALVHGAWHGAWCWARLVPALEAHGHSVITVDLPSDDPAKGSDDYAAVVVDRLETHGSGDVVVVGHSSAGLTIPLVAARIAVSRLVYLCALVPVPGASFIDQLRTEDVVDRGYMGGLGAADADGLRGWADERLARDYPYADCEPEVAADAIARLRPQAESPYVARAPRRGSGGDAGWPLAVPVAARPPCRRAPPRRAASVIDAVVTDSMEFWLRGAASAPASKRDPGTVVGDGQPPQLSAEDRGAFGAAQCSEPERGDDPSRHPGDQRARRTSLVTTAPAATTAPRRWRCRRGRRRGVLPQQPLILDRPGGTTTDRRSVGPRTHASLDCCRRLDARGRESRGAGVRCGALFPVPD